MLFSGPHSKHHGSELNVKASPDSEETLTQVTTFKYLGVELDEHLSCDCHVDKFAER